MALHYQPGHDKATTAFRALRDIRFLRELDICINEAAWKAVQNNTYTAPEYRNILKIPGIPVLQSFRGLKAVRFHGDCETFKSLAPEMTKEVMEVAMMPRKRKAKSGDNKAAVDGEDGPAKRTRGRKAKSD